MNILYIHNFLACGCGSFIIHTWNGYGSLFSSQHILEIQHSSICNINGDMDVQLGRDTSASLLVPWIRALKRVTWKMPAYANRLFESGM
jgi:hypothetical protein